MKALWERVAHGESLSWPLSESGRSLGLVGSELWLSRSEAKASSLSCRSFHFCLICKYRNHLNLFLVVPHRVSFLFEFIFYCKLS